MDLDLPPVQSGTVNEVRRRLIDDICAKRFPDGRLPTSAQLAERFQIGTATVNRAMKCLQKEGWVDRQAGVGTFLGPRSLSADKSGSQHSVSETNSRSTFRLAVVVLPLAVSLRDWHVQNLLSGIDAGAAEHGNVVVEMIGSQNADNRIIGRRLTQSLPDFVVFLKPLSKSAPVIAEAERLGISYLATGTHWRDLEVPTVEEDGHAGAREATQRMIQEGHERIGLVVPDSCAPLWFDRRHGYEQAMLEAFGQVDRNLVHWLPTEGSVGNGSSLEAFIQKQKVTALLFARGEHVQLLKPIIRSRKLQIPRDLSFTTFDGRYELYRKTLGSIVPAVVELPLFAMGKRAVDLACSHQAGEKLPLRDLVPCPLVEGATVCPPQY